MRYETAAEEISGAKVSKQVNMECGRAEPEEVNVDKRAHGTYDVEGEGARRTERSAKQRV